jgi:hypothetical protein
MIVERLSASRPTGGARRAWLIAALLTLANPLLHKSISDACDAARARWGFEAYNRVALVAIPLVTLLAASPIFIRRRAFLRDRTTLAGVVMLGFMSLAAQRWLLVANVELIHVPQFALLAVLLLAAGLNAPAAYIVSTVAGVLDETYQHLVIYAGVEGTYFDINDIVLNAIGAAWGVVLFAEMFAARVKEVRGDAYVVAPAPDRGGRQWPWRWGATIAVLAFPIVLWLDPPRFRPLLSPTTSGRAMYRVMSSAEGLVVCTLLWGMTRFVTRTEIIDAPVQEAWN